MADQLVLTFAEIEFLLRSRPEQAEAVREQLRFNPAANSEVVAAAGIGSLLARGLCKLEGEEVVPTDRIVGVVAGLSTSQTHTEAAGWVGTQTVVLHLFDCPSLRLAILPSSFGQYSVELLDITEPLIGPVTRFLDSCSAGDAQVAVAIRSGTGDDAVQIAVARDDEGRWHSSDSQQSPDRGQATTREEMLQRIADLLGPRAVGAHA